MKEDAISLRQVIVLAAAGMFAPAADLLPGLLAGRVGGFAWATPLLLLPIVLLWGALLCRLFREEGSGLFSLLRRRAGRRLGGAFTLLYIMWGIALLSEEALRCAARISTVYGGRGGRVAALLVLALVVWLLWRKEGALFRAGELFWLGGTVVLLGVLAMGLAQARWKELLPAGGEWQRQSAGIAPYLNVWGTVVFAGALLERVPRKKGAVRSVLSWMAGVSLAVAALLGMVLGQTGEILTGRLERPFLVAVQGLSLEGALARLEAPVAALWLLADFCYSALILAGLKRAGGERWGRPLLLGAFFLAALIEMGRFDLPGMEFGGLILGIFVPFCLWVGELLVGERKGDATSCGQ